ncbi:MAG: hypothetical protein ACK5MY_07450 [Jhaorihella sp.]
MSGPVPGPEKTRPTQLGVYDRPGRQSLTGIEIAALALSLVWLVGAAGFFMLAPGGQQDGVQGSRFLTVMLTIFMPVAMIWVAATAARASRVMREESRRLQTAIDAIRQTQIAQAQRGAAGTEPSVSRKLDEIAMATKKTETALATFHTSRRETPRPAAAPAGAAGGDQGSLELGTPAEALSPPLPTEDFIRALNFPETAEDEEGFAALRRALRDRKAALLIRAAQDVLTLLSQDGIYMDDLRPDMARPEVWRQFAQGGRGRAVAGLGGVRDRTSLALTSARMKQDPIFRDAAHHFLRRFDQTFAEFEAQASDAEISALGETRTARAFMLLGRVAGTFN